MQSLQRTNVQTRPIEVDSLNDQFNKSNPNGYGLI